MSPFIAKLILHHKNKSLKNRKEQQVEDKINLGDKLHHSLFTD
jgi:hypothetical protein